MTTQSVFLFPGQGSQFVGMGKDLNNEFPEFSQTLEEASDALGFDMKALCFDDKNQQLTLTEFTQPAILAVSIGIYRVLNVRKGLKPDLVAGHSLGEYSALVALGALNFHEAVKAVRYRGQVMQRAVPVGVGAMAAYLGTQRDAVIQICRSISNESNTVEVANDNSPSQLVLSGHTDAVEKVCALIAERQLGRAKKLPVSAPFHSSLMKPAALEMENYFKEQGIQMKPFDGKIVANINAQAETKESYVIDMLIKQIAGPVLWTQTMKTLRTSCPDAVWVEAGPGKVLQGLVKKTYPEQKCVITQNVTSVSEVIQ